MRLRDWQAAGERWSWRGHDVFYRREGAGDALVLIHGFPTASWDWHRIWPGLVDGFDVIAPDMIGFGFSAKPRDYAYSLMDQAALHESLLGDLGVGSVHLLAHDYGDTVAQELLARHAERRARGEDGLAIRSACLLNGGVFPGVHRPLAIQKLLMGPLGFLLARLTTRRTLERSFDRIFAPATRPSAAELDEFWTLVTHGGGRRIVHKLMRYMAERERHHDRWVGVIEDPPVPVRLIDGLVDPISGAHLVAHYRRHVRDPDVVELPDVGHYPQVEAPAATLEAFRAFHARLATA